MQLQLALDFFTVEGAKEVLRQVADFIDIAEVGTPFVVQDGMHAVRTIRREFSGLAVLADLKIMDAGAREAETAAAAGAAYVTVLGVAADATIRATVDAAHGAGAKVMVDLIEVPDVKRRAAEVDALGVDIVCAHTAFDLQAAGKNPLDELLLVQGAVKNAKTAVAGGITLETLPAILQAGPDIIIVGGGITGRPDVRAAAMEMRGMMDSRAPGPEKHETGRDGQ